MLILIRPERIATSRHNSRPGGSSIVLLWGLFLDAAQGPGGGLDELHLCFCRNGGYTGALIEWAKAMFGYSLEIVKRNEQHLFRVLPKRWIVERTFAWLNWSRRLSKDYELRHDSAETMIHIAFAHLLLRRYP